VWHDDGRMMATWFQGSADDFIRVTKEGWDKGVSILHSSAAARSTCAARARSRRPR
jgi:hypothetical protein